MAKAFRGQAAACESLGSAFTARVLRCVADRLRPGIAVFDRLLGWQGDPTSAGDSIPLRLAGGLHALVLSGQDQQLAAVYPANKAPSDAALGDAILDAIITNQTTLMTWLDNPPQTNEVARSAVLVAVGQNLTARFDLPLRLLELGASAGLNLYWDRIRLEIGNRAFGPMDASVTLTPEWTGPTPPTAQMEVATRGGVDINPLDPGVANDRLRMMSYVWPDQPDRLARMRAVLAEAQKNPAPIDKGDAADWISKKLQTPASGVTTVVFHTVAWQYFPAATQAAARAAILHAGKGATKTAPLAWFGMENDGRRDSAALKLHLWPDNVCLDLGRADFHGRWVNWQIGQSVLPESGQFSICATKGKAWTVSETK